MTLRFYKVALELIGNDDKLRQSGLGVCETALSAFNAFLQGIVLGAHRLALFCGCL